VSLGNDTTQCGGSITLDAGSFSSYAWSTGATSSTISVSTSGSYNVLVTDANGCQDRDTVQVTINALPTVSLGNDTTQCGGSITLDAGSFSSYTWSTGATTSTISVSTTGSYHVLVTDANRCQDRDTIDVTINTLPTVSLGNDTTQCGGSITLDAGSFSSYAWSTGATTSTISVSTSGSYNVLVTDANGCQDSDTIQVTINALPTVSLGNDTTQCGGSITLDAGSFSSYTWSTGATSSTISVSTSGSYNVLVTDANGCQDRDTVQVTINALPTVSLGNDTTQCGGSITLDAGSFSSYTWSTGATTSTIYVSTTGSYHVLVTDANRCQDRDTIDVTINALPTVSLGNDTTQCGGSITLDAGSFSSYAWSTGATTSTISVSTTGSYNVLVTDANGCQDRDTIQVTINALPTVSLGNDTTQCGGSITLDAGSFSSYAWSTGATSSTISVSTSGSYNVLVTDANGCQDRDTVQVTINALPTVSLGNDTTQCGGSITLDAGSFSSYTWSTGATTSTISVSTTGSYHVLVTDANRCQDRDTIDVTINTLPTVSLGNDTTQCGGSITLDAGSFSSYAWSTGATTSTISVSTSGSYNVLVTDANGCQDSDTIDVTINALPTVSLGNDTTQCGGKITLDAGSFSSYAWSTGATSSTISVSTTGSYSVLVTDANGCQDRDTIQVTINALPTVSLGNDTTQCGGSITLDAGSFSSYAWSTGATSSAISVSTTGSYNILVTDANGCQDRDTIQVTINALPTVNLGNDTTQCGGSITLDAGSFSGYSWSTGATTSTISVSTTGSYNVLVTDANGCQDRDTVLITLFDEPNFNFGADRVTCADSFVLNVPKFTRYSWSSGDTTGSITIKNGGTYWLEVEDSNGCVVSDTIVVKMIIPMKDFLNDFDTICQGDSIDAGLGANYLWNTSSSARKILPTSPGLYFVSKIDTSGCLVSDSVTVEIEKSPVASFSFAYGGKTATDFDVNFTNNSSDGESFKWYFGDGDSSELESPSHTYQNGKYEVLMMVSNRCGSDTTIDSVSSVSSTTDLIRRNLRVYPNPSDDMVFVDFGIKMASPISVALISMEGKTVYKMTLDLDESGRTSLNLKELQRGVYVLEVHGDFGTIKERVIKH
jgi:hypothetical protein